VTSNVKNSKKAAPSRGSVEGAPGS
jgi:hypothetical protein